SIGPVTASQRNGRSTLLPRAAKGNVPRGTRSIVVTITATRESGVYNDGYADNISLMLAARPAPEAPKTIFRFTASGPARETPPVPHYVASSLRGSGTLKQR